MGYGLTPALAQRLIDLGPDYCDYFEHCFPEIMFQCGHRKEGCKFCAREENDPS